MARAEKAGTISHLEKFEGVYADYSDVDFHSMSNQLAKGAAIFSELPAEMRREFDQDPQKFFQYVNDPANKDELLEKLPGLAAPGRQLNPSVAPTADEIAALPPTSPPEADDQPIPTPVVATTTPPPPAGEA